MCTISEVGHGKRQTTCKTEIPAASFCRCHIAGAASLQFSGLVQVKEHADSECHKQAVDFSKVVDNTSNVETSDRDSPNVKRKPSGQHSIQKFFCPLNAERPLDHVQQPKLEKVRCYHLWDPEVVKHFKADRQIRLWTAKSLFNQKITSEDICCFKTIGHGNCRDYIQCRPDILLTRKKTQKRQKKATGRFTFP